MSGQVTAILCKRGTYVDFPCFGTMHNGVMHVPYMTRLANGWPDLAVRVNTVAVAFIVPAILWAGPRFGGIGGAGTWFALKPTHVPYRCPFHAPQNLSPREMAMASRCCFPAALPTDSPAHGRRFSQLSPLVTGVAMLAAPASQTLFQLKVKRARGTRLDD